MKFLSILTLSSLLGIVILALSIAFDEYTPALFAGLSSLLLLLVVAGDYSARDRHIQLRGYRPLDFSAPSSSKDLRRAA